MRRCIFVALFAVCGLSCSSPSALQDVEVRSSALNGSIQWENPPLSNPPGITPTGLTVASWAANRLDVFFTGSDSALWHAFFDGSWHGWESMGGNLASGPAAVSWGPNRLDIVAVDATTHRIAHLWYDNGWGFWELRGQAVAVSAPAISSSAVGRLDIFSRNSSGNVQQMFFDGGWHETWVSLGGTTGTSALSAVSWGPQRIDVFGASSALKLEHHWTVNSGSTWNDDLTLLDGINAANTVSVASRAFGLLDLFYTDPNGHLRHRTFDSVWTGAVDSGTLINTPAAASWAPGRLDVFGYANGFPGSFPQHGRYVIGDDVYTQHNDAQRSGLQPSERELNTGNVNTTHFGLLTRLAVDGEVYAQPLFITNEVQRNLVIVATERNSVYAFDADTFQKVWSLEAGAGHPLGFGVPIPQPDIGNHGSFGNNMNMSGISSTPVIDPVANVVYVEAFSAVDPSTGADVQMPTCGTQDCPTLAQPPHVYRHKLYVINLASGAIANSVVIGGSTAGVTFDPRMQLQRPGLLFLNNSVYVAFGAYTDSPPYRGWVFKYANNLTQTPAMFVTTNETGSGVVGGGIWQSGQGLVTDGTKIYLQTGNGNFNGTTMWGDTVLALSPTTLARLDSFTPWNQDNIRAGDLDLASSGPTLIDNNRLITGGKPGVMYVLNRSDLGGYQQGPGPTIALDRVLQAFQATWIPTTSCPGAFYSNIHGAPVVWHDPNQGGNPTVYVWGEMDWLRGYVVSPTGAPVATSASTQAGRAASCPAQGCTCYDIYPCGVPTSHSTVAAACGMPGAVLSISASDSFAGTGIVWAAMPTAADATAQSVPGTLRAFDAQNVSRELWNSDMVSADSLGQFGKFAAPTISNGKVFVATQSNQVDVYGLKASNRYSP